MSRSADPNGPDTSVNFDAGWYVDANADTPDMLQVALDKPEYHAGDTMTVAVTARNAGAVTLNVIGDHLLATQTAAVKEGTTKLKVPVGRDWGTGAYIVATLRRPLDAPAQRMPGRAIGVQWFSIDKAAKTLTVDLKPPSLLRPEYDAAYPGQGRRVLPPARRRASRSPPSMSASSISPITSRRRRATIISASARCRPTSAIFTAN